MAVITRPDGPTHTLDGTRFTSLATPSRGSADTSVWQVEIDPGTPVRLHRLTREEVFVVLEGAARVHLGGEVSSATRGDAIVVPVGVDFGIEPATDEPLTLICCLPTDGQAVMDGTAFTPPWAL